MQFKKNKTKKTHFLRLIKLKIPQNRHVYKSTIAQHPNTNALPGNKYTHADVQVCLWGAGELTGSCGEDEDARFRLVPGGDACPTIQEVLSAFQARRKVCVLLLPPPLTIPRLPAVAPESRFSAPANHLTSFNPASAQNRCKGFWVSFDA